jgi:hypothetical protein
MREFATPPPLYPSNKEKNPTRQQNKIRIRMARLRDAKYSVPPPNVRATNLRVEMERLHLAVAAEIPQ